MEWKGLFCILDLECRIPEMNAPVHVINIDIQDNHEEATIGAFLITELAMLVSFVATNWIAFYQTFYINQFCT